MNKIIKGAQEAVEFIKRMNEADDIVTRLRGWADVLAIPSGKFANEDLRFAADEIERLRAENEVYKAADYEALKS